MKTLCVTILCTMMWMSGIGQVRMINVDPDSEEITLRNYGGAVVDVSNYFICNRPQYMMLSGLTLVSGSLNIDPDETVVLSASAVGGFGFSGTDQELGLYTTNSFMDTSALVDYVQWGAASGMTRADVADSKGIWTETDFLSADWPFHFVGDGTGMQYGLSSWSAHAPFQVRIIKVDPDSSYFIVRNYGDDPIDISNHFMCAFPDYEPLSNATIKAGSLMNLLPGDYVALDISQTSITLPAVGGDLALYVNPNPSQFTSMADFVQYGSSVSGREDVAERAGLWTDGDFVSGDFPLHYVGDGETNGMDNWTGHEPFEVRLVEVDPGSSSFTVKNFGDAAIDISGFFMCAFPEYAPLSAASVTSGSLSNLMPDAEVVLDISGTTLSLPSTGGDMALYVTPLPPQFTSMIDFFQYIASVGGREDVAEQAGLWTDGDFVAGNAPYTYTGDGTQNGKTFWDATVVNGISTTTANGYEVSIYPNPVTSEASIKVDASLIGTQNLTITIYHINGQQVFSQLISADQVQKISLDDILPGVYGYHLTGNGEIINSGRIIVSGS